ncbi:MAG TPA: hypothetical protein VM554_13070 [Acidisarcina sp.]|nr:hypothetical protein [Acidisarcina sp.]
MKYFGELLAEPGTCRFCSCSEESPCSWHRQEGPYWVNTQRNCCTAPGCIRARERELAARNQAARDIKRRRTPAEVHALIQGKRKRSRKGRVA